MKDLLIVLAVLIGITAFILLFSFFCYKVTFFQKKKNKTTSSHFTLPPGKEYLPHKELFISWKEKVGKLEKREFTLTSFDGHTLKAYYYEYDKNAPIELMLHGYRGSAVRDMCGGVLRCFALKRNAFVIDHRASGNSDGNVITFGVNESRDCLDWVNFIIKTFGENVKIIITGISMGASTALIASAAELPKNVKYVLADCGYTSAKDIIKKFMRAHYLPATLIYPFIKLGAKLYGKFDLEKVSSIESVKSSKVPILLIHGSADDFVPYNMSELNYAACSNKKKLVEIDGAAHGLAYVIDSEKYLQAILDFEKEIDFNSL